MKQPSLKRALVSAMFITAVAAVLLACTILTLYEFNSYKQNLVRQLTSLAQTIAANSSALLVYGDQSVALEVLSSLKSEPAAVAACFYDKAGHLYSFYPTNLVARDFPKTPGPAGQRFSEMHLTIIEPIEEKGARLGTLLIRGNLSGIYRSLELYLAVVMAVMVASAALALALSNLFQGQITRPLFSLAEVARRISQEKDFSVRADPVGRAEEFRLLTEAFNEMLEGIHAREVALQEAQRQLRQYAADLEVRVAERTQSLEETTRQLYDFCYSVAHDLKAPIRAQVAYATLLLEDYGEQLGPEAAGYAKRIEEAGERQGKLVNDLLAHVSLGRSDLPLEAVELAGIAKNVLADLHLEIERHGAALELGGVSGRVIANPASLHLVLSNLLLNALKFVPRGRPPRVRAWTERRGDFLRVWVEDNGLGIPRQHLDKLFGMFQRLHTREEYPGTGIGLALVKRATERMKGQVGVESEEGKGSRFWLELPAAMPIEASAQDPNDRPGIMATHTK